MTAYPCDVPDEQTLAARRRYRIGLIIDTLGGTSALQDADGGLEEALERADRYLLIERRWTGDRGYWITGARSADEATSFHLGQEGAEAWELIGLVDVVTGQRWNGTPVIKWTRADPAAFPPFALGSALP